jgi:SpoVK/Ycf46/Vps4 family AAA+-type ATPase
MPRSPQRTRPKPNSPVKPAARLRQIRPTNRRRGPGTRILVTGTTAAQRRRLAGEVAADLQREILRVDLSQTVGKYIGETEKNLQVLFANAESNGTILFFDEADALFGRRTSVKDSHDKYANQEVSYLIERLEESPAVVILATNSKQAIDPAFQRRLRLSLQVMTGPARKSGARREKDGINAGAAHPRKKKS